MPRSTAIHEGWRARWTLLLALFASILQGAEEDKWKQAIVSAQGLQEKRQFAEARSVLLAVVTEAAGQSDREYRLAYTFHKLGSIAQDQGRYFEAEDHYRRSIAHWEAAGERWRGNLAKTLNNLSSLLYDAGKLREAEELLKRAEAIQVQLAGGGDPDIVTLMNSGLLHFRLRRFPKQRKVTGTPGRFWRRNGIHGKWTSQPWPITSVCSATRPAGRRTRKPISLPRNKAGKDWSSAIRLQ